MKITFIITAILIFSMSAMGQMIPRDASAVIAGPVLIDGKVNMTVGYSVELIGLQFVSFGKFGETAELEEEIVKLFEITQQLYIGPLAGFGVDWSDKPGTGGEMVSSYLFGAVGAGITYRIFNRIGVWGFWKRHISEKMNDPTAGVGLFFKF